MKRYFSTITLLAVVGCSSQDSKVVVSPTPTEQQKRQKAAQAKAVAKANAKRVALEKKQKAAEAKELADRQKEAAEEEEDAKKEERRVKKLVVRDLGSYEKIGMDWHNIQVASNIKNNSLMVLAGIYHRENPTGNYNFWKGNSQFEAYKNWDINYPDPNYPYPEKWTDENLIATMHKLEDHWRLLDPNEQEIASIE